MKRTILAAFLLIAINTCGQKKDTRISIIPEPVSVVQKQGVFVLPKTIAVAMPSNDDLAYTSAFLQQKLSVPTGSVVKLVNDASAADVILELNKTADPVLGSEGYKLSVAHGKVSIKANKPAGLFYGVQSFIQLLPAAIENRQLTQVTKWEAPAVEITDYPRMGWRGLMLDVSRHFFTVNEVKQYIDAMARYKYNLFHFHLTDDEGWRLQIKSLPKLTEVGAWRVPRTGLFNQLSPPSPGEKNSYGGFYTHEDIKELVRYAKERFVNIMPEIDVPGHSLAAIVSYPELSCTPGANKYTVRAGEPIMDWSHGAPPIALVDNTLCPANEKVYTFMDKVMTEVAALFPFEYIHVGGDEAPHNFWQKNSQVKALMQKEGLKTIPQVQAYFEKRLEKIVNAKGKKFMGWDEILEGGISPTAAVMSWRGEKAGIEASRSGHNVVMTPTTYCYLDYMQADAATDIPIYAGLRLNKTYEYNPVPTGANASKILGGQGNLWTEQIANIRQAEYMTWPRGFAIAESLWSPEKNKNWKNFVAKTETHFERLDNASIKYSPAIFDPAVHVKKSGDHYLVELTPEIEGLGIHYSFDNSEPDHFYPEYKEPLIIPRDASTLRIITYLGKTKVGRMMNLRVDELKKRVN